MPQGSGQLLKSDIIDPLHEPYASGRDESKLDRAGALQAHAEDSGPEQGP